MQESTFQTICLQICILYNFSNCILYFLVSMCKEKTTMAYNLKCFVKAQTNQSDVRQFQYSTGKQSVPYSVKAVIYALVAHPKTWTQ